MLYKHLLRLCIFTAYLYLHLHLISTEAYFLINDPHFKVVFQHKDKPGYIL